MWRRWDSNPQPPACKQRDRGATKVGLCSRITTSDVRRHWRPLWLLYFRAVPLPPGPRVQRLGRARVRDARHASSDRTGDGARRHSFGSTPTRSPRKFPTSDACKDAKARCGSRSPNSQRNLAELGRNLGSVFDPRIPQDPADPTCSPCEPGFRGWTRRTDPVPPTPNGTWRNLGGTSDQCSTPGSPKILPIRPVQGAMRPRAGTTEPKIQTQSLGQGL